MDTHIHTHATVDNDRGVLKKCEIYIKLILPPGGASTRLLHTKKPFMFLVEIMGEYYFLSAFGLIISVIECYINEGKEYKIHACYIMQILLDFLCCKNCKSVSTKFLLL